MQKQTSLRNEQSYLERSSYQMAQRNLKSNASVIDLEKNIKDITEKIELISHELKDAQQEIAQKLLQYQETQAHIQSKRQELEANETRMYDALKVVQQAKAKKESLKEESKEEKKENKNDKKTDKKESDNKKEEVKK